jgi:hypothetical protein
MIWLVNLIGVWYSKAVVFVEHYRLDVRLFPTLRTILSWKCFRQRYRKVIEGRHCVLRQT